MYKTHLLEMKVSHEAINANYEIKTQPWVSKNNCMCNIYVKEIVKTFFVCVNNV